MTFITSDEQIKRVVSAAIAEHESKSVNPEKLYTFSQAARLLGKTYPTICRMVQQKRIIVTGDGKYISQRAIDLYLGT
ncbi:MAG: hypothetical protein Q8J97_02260 [Flavobacteriaceae bacterium]|nr:hypothetical protein [Flavobacteriaceae bacterium]